MESPRFESTPLHIPNMGTIKQASALYPAALQAG